MTGSPSGTPASRRLLWRAGCALLVIVGALVAVAITSVEGGGTDASARTKTAPVTSTVSVDRTTSSEGPTTTLPVPVDPEWPGQPDDPCPSDAEADAWQEALHHAGHQPGDMENLALICRLSAGAQADVDAEIAQAGVVAAAHPTVADAMADGYALPGSGAGTEPNKVHLVRWDRMDGEFDIAEPEQLLYSSSAPDGQLLALVYYVVGSDEDIPAGFAGPTDRWHHHGGLCVAPGHQIVGVNGSRSEPECLAEGGEFGTFDGWMLHVWVLPSHPNPDGIFASLNPTVPT